MNNRQLKKQFAKIKKTRKDFLDHKRDDYSNFTPKCLAHHLWHFGLFKGEYINGVVVEMRGEGGNVMELIPTGSRCGKTPQIERRLS